MRGFCALHLIVCCSFAEQSARSDCIESNRFNLRLQRQRCPCPNRVEISAMNLSSP